MLQQILEARYVDPEMLDLLSEEEKEVRLQKCNESNRYLFS